MAQVRELYDFLAEAELQHYYSAFRTNLKVNTIAQLKYVEDEDLVDLGMTRPEMRRLKKFFKKECPQSTFSKLRKILTKGQELAGGGSSPPPQDRASHPQTSTRTSGQHIIPAESIKVCKVLGEGAFGTVQQASWTTEEGDRIQVAVKCLNQEHAQAGTTEFLKEATNMHSLEHENIVQFFGVVLGGNTIMLVTELAPLRSLLECLKESSLRSSFPVTQLCEFAAQISNGMAYLEGRRLVHRDLSARNILVFAQNKVKISDFGLSRALGAGKDYYQTNFSVNLKLPIAWCAPECINYLKFTSASDVWAYGVTLWEMFSYGFQPWAAFTGQQQLSDTENVYEKEDFQKVLEAIDEPNFQRLEQPDFCPHQYYGLMLKCWSHEPEDRPSFMEASKTLLQMRPEQVQAMKDWDGPQAQPDALPYRTHDIITILDKTPKNALSSGMWKGVNDAGKIGIFPVAETTPYIEIKMSSPLLRDKSGKLVRRESGRKSGRGLRASKIRADMISGPQNDLRHTGHIGMDGATFGDVAFIGNNYDKLPLKVVTPYKPQDDMMSSRSSIATLGETTSNGMKSIDASYSQLSLISDKKSKESSLTGLSQSSTDDTLTDVSSFVGDSDSLMTKSFSGEKVQERYQDFDDFDGFKLPDLSTSLDLDLGPSFMDEVMKAISETRDDKNETSHVNDKSPLIEDSHKLNGHHPATFDNMAMSPSREWAEDTLTNGDTSLEGSIADSSSLTSQEHGVSPQESPPLIEKERRRKINLKLFIPSHSSSRETTPQPELNVKPMSASDERRIDQAIELANEIADITNSQNMSPIITDSGIDDTDIETVKSRSIFSRKKSPKTERRSFTDELAALPDAAEDVTPEAQEAYNLLVVKGAVKESGQDNSKSGREMRVRRALDHQPAESSGSSSNSSLASGSGSSERLGLRNGRGNVNANIRKPAGIPVRGAIDTTTAIDSTHVDTNPLRRLRESAGVIPKPRGSHANGGPAKPEHTHRPNLNANLPFFVKLKEQEDQDSTSEPGSCPNLSSDSSGELPIPPRQPLRPSTINAKPRERKHPLGVAPPAVPPPKPPPRGSSSPGIIITKPDLPPPPPPPQSPSPSKPSTTNTGRNSWNDILSTPIPPPQLSNGDIQSSPSNAHSPLTPAAQVVNMGPDPAFSVKSVKMTAAELGLYDNSDSFWLKRVNFDQLSSASQADLEDENSPMPGRYKTCDNVSYEDLMEFALDGSETVTCDSKPESTMCDEVRIMQRVFNHEVTLEDCMYALEDTEWDVHSAIKLLKLKQLLSTQLANKDGSKRALLRCSWDVQQAAEYLLANPPGQQSPDIVLL